VTKPHVSAKPTVGSHLRMARHARGHTLKQVADAAGCSEGLLSKIENGKADPSLRLLRGVCQFFGIKVGDLLSWAELGHSVVLRVSERVGVRIEQEAGRGTRMERLAHSGIMLAGFLNTYEPGCTGGTLTHDGEEFGFLLSGQIDLTVNDTTYRLAPGDSFCFQSSFPHSYSNPGELEATIIVVNSPPSL
jgi:transcriptional regulator with XRE-family HTH domain